ncbi:unnamed protein product, partial [Rotaria sp. Silwood1]
MIIFHELFLNLVLVLDIRGVELLNTGGPICRYDTREDFTVVIQSFMAHTQLQRKINGNIDFCLFFAPDCFHFS